MTYLLALGQLATARVVLTCMLAEPISHRTEKVHDAVDNDELVRAVFDKAELSAYEENGRIYLPNGKLQEKLALLLRAPRTSTEDVLKRHLTVNAKAIGDRADTVRAECASDVSAWGLKFKAHSVSM